MAITVELVGEDEQGFSLRVRVTEGRGETSHDVTLGKGDHAKLAREGETPAALVHRCFEFLLEREPKESILRRFDVSVIRRYFPEVDEVVGGRGQKRG